jgi:hypothetical protein
MNENKKFNIETTETGVMVKFGAVDVSARKMGYDKDVKGFDSICWNDPAVAKTAIMMSGVPEEEIYTAVAEAFKTRETKLEEARLKERKAKELAELKDYLAYNESFRGKILAELPGASMVAPDAVKLVKQLEEHGYYNKPDDQVAYNNRMYRIGRHYGGSCFEVNIERGDSNDKKKPKTVKGIIKAIKELDSLMNSRAQNTANTEMKEKSQIHTLSILLGKQVVLKTEQKYHHSSYGNRNGYSYEVKHFETAAGTKIERIDDKSVFVETAKSMDTAAMHAFAKKLPGGIQVKLIFTEAIPLEKLQQIVNALES